MTLHISREQARRFLTTYHFTPTDLPGVIDDPSQPYYIPTSALALLDSPPPNQRMIFLGPLDSLLWDRRSLAQIFNFDYIWEVYKPPTSAYGATTSCPSSTATVSSLAWIPASRMAPG